jgi:hypothetical protein
MSEARHEDRRYGGLIFLPWLFGILAYWLIVIADPYHLRIGSTLYSLADHRYPDLEWPRLIGVATAHTHDLVLLGGSSGMPITSQMMREAFPGAQSPVNLSYLAQRPLDMPLVLPRIAQVPGLQHVILFMDFSLLDSAPRPSPTGRMLGRIAETNWSHNAQFGVSTALATLHAVVTGTYDSPGWSVIGGPEFMAGGQPVTRSAELIRQFQGAVRRHANDVFEKSTLTCSQIPYLRNSLVPFLREMTQKHVTVDLVFPLVPFVLYYEWFEFRPPLNDTLLPGAVFDQLTTFKKCVIAARDEAGASGIRVIAVDSNESLAGNLGLYFDTIHPIDPDVYRAELRMIASGDETITADSIDSYEAEVRHKVSQWAVRFSAQ